MTDTSEMSATSKKRRQDWKDPVVLIVYVIVLGTMALIGVAVFQGDGGFLGQMGERNFARGLITYLFSVMTILTAVVLVLAALTVSTSSDDEAKERFQRGKEILALLLGVFGTIVGFYFGSEVSASRPAEMVPLRLTVPHLIPNPAVGGSSVRLTANVSGGAPPYQYGMTMKKESIVDEEVVEKDGWIDRELQTDAVDEATDVKVTLSVKDSAGRIRTTSAMLILTPGKASQ